MKNKVENKQNSEQLSTPAVSNSVCLSCGCVIKHKDVTMNNTRGTWIRGVTGPIYVEIGITTQGLIYIK